MKTTKINLSLDKNGQVSLTHILKLDKNKSLEIEKLIAKRNELGKELTIKLKDMGLVSAANVGDDDATVVD